MTLEVRSASPRVRPIEADSQETGSVELKGKMGAADGGDVMGCLMVGKIKDEDTLSWSTKLQSCSNHDTKPFLPKETSPSLSTQAFISL